MRTLKLRIASCSETNQQKDEIAVATGGTSVGMWQQVH